ERKGGKKGRKKGRKREGERGRGKEGRKEREKRGRKEGKKGEKAPEVNRRPNPQQQGDIGTPKRLSTKRHKPAKDAVA
ncbi:hypothetical protein ACC745_39505, partial [Rhizobium ruizarguesonis]